MIIDKLERMEYFTSQEKEIAKYILENPSLTKELLTEELAKATYTSPSAVVPTYLLGLFPRVKIVKRLRYRLTAIIKSLNWY